MVDFAQLGARLRAALEDSGLLPADLARRASIEPKLLADLTAGRPAKVSTGTLARVARELGVEPTALWATSQPDDTRLSVHFRNAGIPDFFSADRPVLRRALQHAIEVQALNDLLGIKPLLGGGWFPAEPVGAVAYEDGYRRARQVRNALHAKGLLPDADAPLENIDLLVEEAFGIPVLEDDFRAGSVLALTVKTPGAETAAIVLNRASTQGLTPLRRRVDIAHELAHSLFDAPTGKLGLWIDEETDLKAQDATDKVEQRARAFAAELLLPAQGLRRLLGDPPASHLGVQQASELVQRARTHFGTPIEIATNHLANHGYFPKGLREAVKGAVPPSDPSPPTGGRRILERRVRDAVARGLMTQMRARELLSLSARDPLILAEE